MSDKQWDWADDLAKRLIVRHLDITGGDFGEYDEITQGVAAALRTAVETERERCAAAVEAVRTARWPKEAHRSDSYDLDTCDEIARRIIND